MGETFGSARSLAAERGPGLLALFRWGLLLGSQPGFPDGAAQAASGDVEGNPVRPLRL